jgi:hypothetical protein
MQWLKQAGESSKAHAAFRIYLELGTNRSIDIAYRAAKEQQASSKRASGTWMTWASRNNWVARAQAYDRYLISLEAAQREDTIKAKAKEWHERRDAIRAREIEIAEKLIERAERMLEYPLIEQTLQRDGKTIIIQPAVWTMATVPRFAEVAFKLLRLNADLETDRVMHDVTGLYNAGLERILNSLEAALPAEWYAVALEAIHRDSHKSVETNFLEVA